MSKVLRWLTTLAVITVIVGAGFVLSPAQLLDGVDVEDIVVADPDDKPLATRVWYPAGKAQRLPLIVVSHGTGGSNRDHEDSATELARAGFVVAAVTHTGDNYRDTSYIGKGMQLVGRPRHVARVIDHILTRWPQHARIDTARIGLFGHSAGGFTGLVVAGGEADMSRGPERCRRRPEAWDCRYLRKHGLDVARIAGKQPPIRWVHDARVRAAVITAPAIGYSFEPDRLAPVRIPIQLWEAQHDAIVEDSPAIIRRLLPQAQYRGVAAAGHFSFMAPCDWGKATIISVRGGLFGTPDICADPRGFDRQAFHKRFNRDVIAFFRTTLPSGH